MEKKGKLYAEYLVFSVIFKIWKFTLKWNGFQIVHSFNNAGPKSAQIMRNDWWL